MSSQFKSYMCVVTNGCGELDIIMDDSYVNLIRKLISNIIETHGDDYPDIAKYTVPNSIDFIVDRNEDDFKYLLDEILYFLNQKGSDYSAKLFELDHVIDNDKIDLYHNPL